MELIPIYECLCNQTRVRILHLLTQGPLCVCHFQEILNEPQVKVSKHLAYLRTRKMVQTKRYGNWMIYALPDKRVAELDANLQCLQDCAQSHPRFKRDLKKLAALQSHPDHSLMSSTRLGEPMEPARLRAGEDKHVPLTGSRASRLQRIHR